MSLDFKEIARRLRTQDNLATADPLYVVYEKERIYGIDPDYHGRAEIRWRDEDGELYTAVKEDQQFEKVYFIEKDKFVNAHFTEAAAKKYIHQNGHNLTKPFIYVTSLHRCEEMKAIRQFLMEAAQAHNMEAKEPKNGELLGALKDAIGMIEGYEKDHVSKNGIGSGDKNAQKYHKIRALIEKTGAE